MESVSKLVFLKYQESRYGVQPVIDMYVPVGTHHWKQKCHQPVMAAPPSFDSRGLQASLYGGFTFPRQLESTWGAGRCQGTEVGLVGGIL